jgi:hypothetical protein
MTDERIRRAAQWVQAAANEAEWRAHHPQNLWKTGAMDAAAEAAADAAHILSLLAEGKAVLAEAEPKQHVKLFPRDAEGRIVALHAPLDPWSTKP